MQFNDYTMKQLEMLAKNPSLFDSLEDELEISCFCGD